MKQYITSDKLKYHAENVAQFVRTGFANPISVQFQITNRCRFRCIYCDKVLNDEESDVTDRLIERLHELGVRSIVLTGGEPVLYSRFQQHIPLLARHFQLGLVTTLCEYQPLLETHFQWVKVSMDTVDEKVFRRIKKGQGIDKILANIEKLYENKKNNMPLGTQIVLTHENKSYEELSRFIDCVYNICDYIQIRPIESVDQYEYTVEDHIRLKLLKERYSKLTISDKFELNHKPSSCPARWCQLLIDVHHNVMLCCNRVEEQLANLYDPDLLTKSKKLVIDYSKCYHSCVMAGNNHYLESLSAGAHQDFV